jgi:hypothetical protein
MQQSPPPQPMSHSHLRSARHAGASATEASAPAIAFPLPAADSTSAFGNQRQRPWPQQPRGQSEPSNRSHAAPPKPGAHTQRVPANDAATSARGMWYIWRAVVGVMVMARSGSTQTCRADAVPAAVVGAAWTRDRRVARAARPPLVARASGRASTRRNASAVAIAIDPGARLCKYGQPAVVADPARRALAAPPLATAVPVAVGRAAWGYALARLAVEPRRAVAACAEAQAPAAAAERAPRAISASSRARRPARNRLARDARGAVRRRHAVATAATCDDEGVPGEVSAGARASRGGEEVR